MLIEVWFRAGTTQGRSFVGEAKRLGPVWCPRPRHALPAPLRRLCFSRTPRTRSYTKLVWRHHASFVLLLLPSHHKVPDARPNLWKLPKPYSWLHLPLPLCVPHRSGHGHLLCRSHSQPPVGVEASESYRPATLASPVFTPKLYSFSPLTLEATNSSQRYHPAGRFATPTGSSLF